MKRKMISVILTTLVFMLFSLPLWSQCSICTKTAQQLGEGPAKGLNAGIIYLMVTPLAIIGFVGFRWWKQNRDD